MLTRGFAQLGLTRNDVVIGVGGGMVTDVAGFAAATWHRGVPVVHVATTLLGMVDAAIGGKTGVNLPEGKNLVGAFWQPSGVVCDLDALATLPDRERRSGDGEMAKYHFLTGDDLDAMTLTDRVARCVEIKADVVASDEREGGRRALLNYGHTLAHALEIATEHRLTHGEAVGVGLVYAAELAQRLGRIDADRVDEHRAVVGGHVRPADDRPRRAGDRRPRDADGPRQEGADGRPDVRARRCRRRRGRPRRARGRGAGRVRRRPGVIPEVRTERLLLRGWTDADRPAYAAINADPLVMEFLGPLQSPGRDRRPHRPHGGPLGRARLRPVVRRPRRRRASASPGWRRPGSCRASRSAGASRRRTGVTATRRRRRRAALAYGFDVVGLAEIVSFTTVRNAKSRRVMEKLGMTHDPAADFDHPRATAELRRHVLYRLAREDRPA